jgi:hypothetical protein
MEKVNMHNTKTEALIEAFESGKELTAAQISARFGLTNPTASITGLRKAGYAIYLNNRNGVSKYRLGKPTRKMIAAGYAALGAEGSGLV